jgi:hypothetical protein
MVISSNVRDGCALSWFLASSQDGGRFPDKAGRSKFGRDLFAAAGVDKLRADVFPMGGHSFRETVADEGVPADAYDRVAEPRQWKDSDAHGHDRVVHESA